MRINTWILFGSIATIYLILTFVSNKIVITEDFFLRSYNDQLTRESLEIILGTQEQYLWVGYVLSPMLLLTKVSFTVICISIGVVLSSLEFEFKTIFKTALLAEVVFIIAQIVYLTTIFIHLDTVTLQTVANYYPLTALSYFGVQNVVDWLQYPLQTLNLFEVFYMMVIAWLLAKQWKENFMESLAIVVPSYGTGLILWLVFVTFITIQVS